MKKMKIGIYILSVLSLGVLVSQVAPELFRRSNNIEIKVQKGSIASLGDNELLLNFYQDRFVRPIGMIQNGEYIQKYERSDSINNTYNLNNSGVYLSKDFRVKYKDLVATFTKLLNGNSILSKEYKTPSIWGLDTENPFIISLVTNYYSGENDYVEIYSYDKDKNFSKIALKLNDLNLDSYYFNSIIDVKLQDNILSVITVNFGGYSSSLVYTKIDLDSSKVICNKSFNGLYTEKSPGAWIGNDYIYAFMSDGRGDNETENISNNLYKINLNNFDVELMLEGENTYYNIDNINNILSIFTESDSGKINLYKINLDNDSINEYNNLPFDPSELSSYDDKLSTYTIGENKLAVIKESYIDGFRENAKSNIKVIDLNSKEIESDISINNYLSIKKIAK